MIFAKNNTLLYAGFQNSASFVPTDHHDMTHLIVILTMKQIFITVDVQPLVIWNTLCTMFKCNKCNY